MGSMRWMAVSAAAELTLGMSLTAQPSPLFESQDVLSLAIRAPFEDIFRHRGQEAEEYPGIVAVTSTGAVDTVAVVIRTRGRTRLDPQICRFPPMRLDFPRTRVGGTLFEGQNRLKLVTHCRDDREEYEQYVLLESLTYRILNTLTDLSFRVRLAYITYEDSRDARSPITRYGFLIEHEEAVAARAGWSYLTAPVIPPEATDPEHLALVEVFQYLIGNTDWSAFSADAGSSECCHNTKPVGAGVGPVFTLPYDFDITGLVNTRYANRLYRGNLENLGLRNVRQRRFRGLCRSAPFWPDIFELFDSRRADIEALFRDQEGLDADVLRETLEYVADFYDVIHDEGRVRREFERRCLEA